MRSLIIVATVVALAVTAEGAVGAQPAARWLFIVDDFHLDFPNTGHLRTLLKTIAIELIHDGDQVALYSTGLSSVSLAWTSDRSAVDRVVKQIAGNGLAVSDILEGTHGGRLTNEVERRATFVFARVNAIIGALGPTLDRRTGIIYISNGYARRPPSSQLVVRAHWPVFAIDPRLLPAAIVDRDGVDTARWNAHWAATRNSLRALSEESGGFALAEGEDLGAALARISDSVRQ